MQDLMLVLMLKLAFASAHRIYDCMSSVAGERGIPEIPATSSSPAE
jgi:hypothetical protein